MKENNNIQTIFNTISNDYDNMNNIISFNQHNKWRNKTMDEIFIHNDDSVLDLCCGTGDWTIQLANSNNQASIYGVDFSENMLKVAQNKTKNYSNIKLTQEDAMNLSYDNNSFDLITIGFGLRNLPDYNNALDEVFRVLKPGGQFVILETSNPKNPFISQLFDFYFGKIMPKFGEFFAKSGNEYQWLYESTRNFVSKEQLKTLLYNAGFINIKITPHSMGMAATHFAHKPLNYA